MTAKFLQSFPPILSGEMAHVLFIWESKLTRLPEFPLAEVGQPYPQEWVRLKPWEEGAKVSQRGPRHVPESGHGLVSRHSLCSNGKWEFSQ